MSLLEYTETELLTHVLYRVKNGPGQSTTSGLLPRLRELAGCLGFELVSVDRQEKSDTDGIPFKLFVESIPKLTGAGIGVAVGPETVTKDILRIYPQCIPELRRPCPLESMKIPGVEPESLHLAHESHEINGRTEENNGIDLLFLQV